MFKLLLWQILCEAVALQAAPQTGTDVCSSLAAPRFAVRHQCELALIRAWPYSAAALARAAASADPHVADLARRIQVKARDRAIQLAGPAPRADFLWHCGHETWRALWLRRPLDRALDDEPQIEVASWVGSEWIWGDDAFRAVSLRWAADLLDRGLPPPLVRIWFTAGRKIEADHPPPDPTQRFCP